VREREKRREERERGNLEFGEEEKAKVAEK